MGAGCCLNGETREQTLENIVRWGSGWLKSLANDVGTVIATIDRICNCRHFSLEECQKPEDIAAMHAELNSTQEILLGLKRMLARKYMDEGEGGVMIWYSLMNSASIHSEQSLGNERVEVISHCCPHDVDGLGNFKATEQFVWVYEHASYFRQAYSPSALAAKLRSILNDAKIDTNTRHCVVFYDRAAFEMLRKRMGDEELVTRFPNARFYVVDKAIREVELCLPAQDEEDAAAVDGAATGKLMSPPPEWLRDKDSNAGDTAESLAGDTHGFSPSSSEGATAEEVELLF